MGAMGAAIKTIGKSIFNTSKCISETIIKWIKKVPIPEKLFTYLKLFGILDPSLLFSILIDLFKGKTKKEIIEDILNCITKNLVKKFYKIIIYLVMKYYRDSLLKYIFIMLAPSVFGTSLTMEIVLDILLKVFSKKFFSMIM